MKQFFILLFFIPAFQISAQTPSKIDQRLWERLHEQPKAECLIVLQAQADVSPARLMHSKREKGEYVYQTLSALAEATQEPVREVLRSAQVPAQSFWVINALWAEIDLALALRLAEMPEIERIEDNPVWEMEKRPEFFPPIADRSLDPWGIDKINAPAVWSMGFEGQGVVVGGQDTGYEWGHPAIKQKYRGWNASNSTVNHNYNWHDAIHSLVGGGSNSCGLNLKSPCDDHSHGTHTVGTMVGGVNADSMIGVAPLAKWMGCRNMEEGDGTPATYIECFEWFIAPTDTNNANPNSAMSPHVINNSWGCPTSEGCNSTNYATMNTVVNNVRAAGILVVVSAGNSGPACGTVNTPAAVYSGSFSVGATDINDGIASFSSKGPTSIFHTIRKPNVSAPGVGVASCVGYDRQSSSYSYSSWNGTSMAGPHVAGLAALMMSARTDLIGEVDVLEDLIENSAVEILPTTLCGDDTPTSSPNNTFGHGRINAQAAVAAALAFPVELIAFDAYGVDRGVQLDWRTSVHPDCRIFEIERSPDGIKWTKIGETPCANPQGNEASYAYLDQNPLSGLNYYRLHQIDWSGLAVYSKSVVWNNRHGLTAFGLTPHRANQTVVVNLQGIDDESVYAMTIISADGKVVASSPAVDRAVVALPLLQSGMYAVRLTDETGALIATTKLPWW